MKIISEKKYKETWGKFEKIFSRQLKDKRYPKKVFFFISNNISYMLNSIDVNENEIMNLFDKYELALPGYNVNSIMPTFLKK